MTEHPLGGGNVADGIVRVGDTVRKPAGYWTPAVEALLSHLWRRGFTGAPRPLGRDVKGRHLLANGARTGTQPWARLHADGHGEHWAAAADYIERNLPAWRRALR